MAVRGGSEDLSLREQQLEAAEEKLGQRQAALSEGLRALGQRQQALAAQAQELASLGVVTPQRTSQALSWDAPPASAEVKAARDAAEALRRQAVAARQRALDLWEEELVARGQTLAQAGLRLASAQDELEAAQLAASEAEAAQLTQPPPPPEAMLLAGEAVRMERASRTPTPLPVPPRPTRLTPPQPRAVRVATGVNQRTHARARLKVQVDFESDHNFFTGFSADISEGGLFVATFNVQPLGSQVEVAFALPTGEHIMARGSVKWVRDSREMAGSETPPGMGIQFERLPDEAREAVHRFITQRDPIFYDE